MRPRGENIEYDKLRDRFDALAAELADVRTLAQMNVQTRMAAQARIAALEAALQGLLEFIMVREGYHSDNPDIATALACFPGETPTTKSRSVGSTLETLTEPPIQRACTCVIYCSQKDKLASDQYCHADRRESGLAQETEDRCTCWSPFDQKPGHWHKLTCPNYVAETPDEEGCANCGNYRSLHPVANCSEFQSKIKGEQHEG